jgi:HSP20 family molecular chaperone IbpA
MCPMTKLTLGSHPFLLGFDQLERLVERTAKSGNDGYPPYNIEQRGENAYRITLAVAGFAEADLSITVEDKQLVVRGKQSEDDGGRGCRASGSRWDSGGRARRRVRSGAVPGADWKRLYSLM